MEIEKAFDRWESGSVFIIAQYHFRPFKRMTYAHVERDTSNGLFSSQTRWPEVPLEAVVPVLIPPALALFWGVSEGRMFKVHSTQN